MLRSLYLKNEASSSSAKIFVCRIFGGFKFLSSTIELNVTQFIKIRPRVCLEILVYRIFGGFKFLLQRKKLKNI